MGTDIHFRVEKRESAHEPWQIVKPEPQPDQLGRLQRDWSAPRDYLFFALVAGVRNQRHLPEMPPRGLPADMASPFDNSPLAGPDGDDYEIADAAGQTWLGEHSYTWYELSELQAAWRSERWAPYIEEIDSTYHRLIFATWNALSDDPRNVRIIMGFDS